MNDNQIVEGINCRDVFKQAYENRYTWPNTFSGYRGLCEYKTPRENYHGTFQLEKIKRLVFQV